MFDRFLKFLSQKTMKRDMSELTNQEEGFHELLSIPKVSIEDREEEKKARKTLSSNF